MGEFTKELEKTIRRERMRGQRINIDSMIAKGKNLDRAWIGKCRKETVEGSVIVKNICK